MKKKALVDFFKDEVRGFSIYSCERSLPSGIDGLKTSQRKVVFGMQKKFNNQEVKVSIASAGIMEISCYHHGSLDGVIVNMAQGFAGSNNMPLLDSIGQFGSRISPDSAATRYIFTKLSNNYRQLFSNLDDPILEHNDDDGVEVEPRYYLPLLPTILVNGADGVGTGYACTVMAYNPKDLKQAITTILSGGKPKSKLVPWYKGFTGKIHKEGDQVVVSGSIEKVNSTTLKITELPVGIYTSKYREHLNKLEEAGTIKSYDDNSSEDKTEFIVRCTREFVDTETEKLLTIFKLVARTTENITVWDENFRIRKFASPDDLLNWFVAFRLTKYEERRQHLIKNALSQIDDYLEQMRFIKLYLKRGKDWSKMTNADVVSELTTEQFKDIPDLLAIKVSRLTGESIDELQLKIDETKVKHAKLVKTTAAELYKEDLDGLKI